MSYRIQTITSVLITFLLSACFGSGPNTKLGARLALANFSCSAQGTIATQSNNSVTLSGLTVTALNAPDDGPFDITVPGQNTIVTDGSSTSYTYPNQVTLSASNGVIQGDATVTDTTNGEQVSCSISSGGPNGPQLGLTPYPNANQGIGGTVIVVPTVTGISDPVYSYVSGSANASVTLATNNGSGVYLVSDNLPESFSFSVTVTSASNSSLTASTSLQLSFSTQYQSPLAEIAVSPNSTVTVGNPIYLFAATTGINNPSYSYSVISGSVSSLTQGSNPMMATVQSNNPGQAVIQVKVAGSNGTYYAQVTLNFNASSSSTLTCTVNIVPGIFYLYSGVVLYITTNTGESVRVLSWNPGEAWNPNGGEPSFPLTPPLEVVYESSGWKNGSLTALGNTSGQSCTATYSVYIQPW
jgi:hypothetical protein